MSVQHMDSQCVKVYVLLRSLVSKRGFDGVMAERVSSRRPSRRRVG